MTVYLDRIITDVDHVDRDTIAGLIVPWGTDNEVADRRPDGTLDHYIETWERGAFAGQDQSGNRGTIMQIALLDDHADGLGKVGYALELSDDADGERGLFRVLPRHRDDVASMLADGIDGLSARFIPKPGGVRVSNMVGRLERRVRSAAHMVHVALVPQPALVGAGVNRADADLAEANAAAELADRRRRTAELFDEMEKMRDRWQHLL